MRWGAAVGSGGAGCRQGAAVDGRGSEQRERFKDAAATKRGSAGQPTGVTRAANRTLSSQAAQKTGAQHSQPHTLRRCMAAQMRRPDAMKVSTRPRQPTMVQASHLHQEGEPHERACEQKQNMVAGAAAALAPERRLAHAGCGRPWIALAAPLRLSLQLSILTCCKPCPSGRSSCANRAGKVPVC